MQKKNWIQGAIRNPGALHKDLGIPKGQDIPDGRLRNAARQGGKVGKRAQLAINLKNMKKGK